MQSINRAPAGKRRWGSGRFAHQILVLAWVAFWLNTAIFPCCEAFATVFGDHGQMISQPATGNQVSQDCDDNQAGQPGHSPYSPCGSFVSAPAATISNATFLPGDNTSWMLPAPAVGVLVPVALNVSNSFIPHEIPPPVRLYLRTLNLRL